jgi:hypothetical protein
MKNPTDILRNCVAIMGIVFVSLTSLAHGAETAREFDFDSDSAGTVPKGFSEALTGDGVPAKWQVVAASGAPSGNHFVAQISEDSTRARYPLLVLDDFSVKDVDVSVKFKPVSGRVDQAAGIVWRLKDKDNYFIVRANALENNVVAYKTVAGVRSSIGIKGDPESYGEKVKVPSGRWSTLRIRMVGNLAEVFLNDEKVLEVENDTFTEAGKVGLWTKADSVTHFDDLTVTSLDEKSDEGSKGRQ